MEKGMHRGDRHRKGNAWGGLTRCARHCESSESYWISSSSELSSLEFSIVVDDDGR